MPLIGALVRRWESLLERRGTRAVLTARLMPLARTFVSLPAGARRVPLVPFIALTMLGCALWAVAFIVVGLLAGAAWVEVSSLLGRVLLAVGLLVIGVGVLRGRRSADAPPQSRAGVR